MSSKIIANGELEIYEEKTKLIEEENDMGNYKLEEDIKVYRDNKSKCLLFTRITLGIVFIILFLMGKKPYEILLIGAISYLIENILNYRKMSYKEDLIASIALAIGIVFLIILIISKYIG